MPITLDKVRQKQAQQPSGAAPATVKHSCGHEKPLADLASRPCPACREKAAQAKRAQKREKDEARKADKATHDLQRLPNGAVYHKTYDAAAKLWTAQLTIPGTPGFTARASGSLRAEFNADRMYREWRQKQAASAEGHC